MNSLSPILVTGGAGFIGSNFIHYLLRFWPGVEIINLDRLDYSGSLENLKDLPVASRHTFVRGDVGDSALVEDLPRRHRIETVVHFAGETHVDRSIAGPEAFIDANVVGTFRLLEACRKTWPPPAPERVTPATAAPAGSRRLGSSWRRPGSTTSTCAGPFCSGRADGAASRAGRRSWGRPDCSALVAADRGPSSPGPPSFQPSTFTIPCSRRSRRGWRRILPRER